MNHQVPEFFQMEDVYSSPTTNMPKNPASDGAGVTELLWENGHVVMQNQRQQKQAVSGVDDEAVVMPEREIQFGGEEQQQPLCLQDDVNEMVSWLHIEDLYPDLLYPSPPAPVSTITQQTPPVTPTYERPDNAPRTQNFGHFSRLPGRPNTESMNQLPVIEVRESTVVESNETPMVRLIPQPRVSPANVESGTVMAGGTYATAGTSSASLSASGEAHQPQMRPEDRKRARENDENEYQSEDTEFEADGAKEPAHGSTSAKRSRAAEVHNLSERKRRDKINVKMRTLQDLIPRCNKTDKASMLDDAIEYMKALQMQLQLMVMGYPMVPVMYPGMQRYMPAMGLSMGMNRPMVPYHPSMPPTSTMPNPAYMTARLPMLSTYPMPQVHPSDPRIQGPGSNQANHPAMHPCSTMPNPAYMNARLPMLSTYPMPQVHPTDPRIQGPGSNQANHLSMPPCSTMPNSAYMSPTLPMLPTYHTQQVHPSDPIIQAPGSNQANHLVNFSQFQNQQGLPNYVDLYQQFVGMQQGQYPIPQNQQVLQPGSNTPITGKDTGNPDTQLG